MRDPILLAQEQPRVLACVDRSHFADSVTDYAAWAAKALSLPLELLHILDRHPELASTGDRSGSIGLAAQESLLEDLVQDEAVRSRAAREEGRLFLSVLRQRAIAAGLDNPSTRQRYGELEATLVEQQPNVALFVLGRRGASAETTGRDLGRNLERVVRALRKPILVVEEAFHPPSRAMIAFDGSTTTRRGVEFVATSPMFRHVVCDVVIAGEAGRRGAAGLAWAQARLAEAGVTVEALTLPGDPERAIAMGMRERGTDLLVMGAFGHSLLHRLFHGSRTSDLLRASTVPTLLIR
jgi:nucleotide-binding universal stress UspA family protein